MEICITIDENFVIPVDRFDNVKFIDGRIQNIPQSDKGHLMSILKFLYLTDGPKNIDKERFKIAESYLDTAERIIARWLRTRTNGHLRKNYGDNALYAARNAKYRCEKCGMPDTRVLQLDHKGGKDDRNFSCLCANCHSIKSREFDW